MNKKDESTRNEQPDTPEMVYVRAIVSPDTEQLKTSSDVPGDKTRPFAFMGMYSKARQDMGSQLIDAQNMYNDMYIDNYKNCHCVMIAPPESGYELNGGKYDVYLQVDDKGEVVIPESIQDLINDKWTIEKGKINKPKTIDTETDPRFDISKMKLYADNWREDYLRYRIARGGDGRKDMVDLERTRMETKQSSVETEQPDNWQ